MPITHRCRIGCTKALLYYWAGITKPEANRPPCPRWNLCIRFIYGVNTKPYKCSGCIFEWRGPYVILWPWEYSPHSFFFFSFFTIAPCFKPLAQFAVNKINWRTDKGIKCCSASEWLTAACGNWLAETPPKWFVQEKHPTIKADVVYPV